MFGEEQWPHCTHCTHCNAPACFFNRIPRSSNRQSPERWCCGDGPPLVTGAFTSAPSLTAGCRSFKIWNMTLVAKHNWTVLYVRFGKCFYSKALCRDMNYFSFVLLKHGWSQRRWIRKPGLLCHTPPTVGCTDLSQLVLKIISNHIKYIFQTSVKEHADTIR